MITPAELNQRERIGCPTVDVRLEELRALLRRDWAVRVLDAWADARRRAGKFHHVDLTVRFDTDGRYVLMMPGRGYHRDTTDATRLAAAEAVWPELPESVRAELGERP